MSIPAEFESMPLIEKGLTLLDKGNLVDTRVEKGHKVFLFNLKGNFVEVYFLLRDKRIDVIRVLDTKDTQKVQSRELQFA